MTAHVCPHCGGALSVSVDARAVAEPVRNAQELGTVREVTEQVRSALAIGPLTADEVQRTVRRRRADVRVALRQLEEAQEVERTSDRRWRTVPVAGTGTYVRRSGLALVEAS